MELVKKVADEEGMWTIRFLENVVPDEQDIRTMSWALAMKPFLVDAMHLSRAKRPRLFWVSVPLVSHEEVEIHEGPFFDEVIYGAATEPMHAILTEGWEWIAGERDTGKPSLLSPEPFPGGGLRRSPRAYRGAPRRQGLDGRQISTVTRLTPTGRISW